MRTLQMDTRLERLKRIKEKSGMANVEIASKIGVREQTVLRWLHSESLDDINGGSQKLIDLFIESHKQYLK